MVEGERALGPTVTLKIAPEDEMQNWIRRLGIPAPESTHGVMKMSAIAFANSCQILGLFDEETAQRWTMTIAMTKANVVSDDEYISKMHSKLWDEEWKKR